MKLNLKKFIFFIFATVVILFNFAPLALAQSTDKKSAEDRCKEFYAGFKIDGSSNAVEGLPQYCTVNQLGTTIINIILALAGSALVLFIIVGGFLLITAGGNEEQSEKGKKVMTNAILGMVVVIMAFAIVKIVTNTLTGNVGQNTSGNTSGTNNTNGSNTTNSGGSGGGANTSGQLTEAEIIRIAGNLMDGVIIPTSVPKTGTLQVTAFFTKQAHEADIKKLCKVESVTAAAMAVEFEGVQIGSRTNFITNGPTSWSGRIAVPGSQLSGTQGVIVVKICDVPVKTETLSIIQ